MAPAGAVLVAVGIKAVVLTHGRKLGIHNPISVDAGIYQCQANGGRKIEHARGTRIDARKLGGKAVHELLGNLVLVTQNMGADVGSNIARLAPGGLAERLARLGGNACDRALPAGMHHGKSAGGHQHHGHAIGKAEQHGHFARRAHTIAFDRAGARPPTDARMAFQPRVKSVYHVR